MKLNKIFEKWLLTPQEFIKKSKRYPGQCGTECPNKMGIERPVCFEIRSLNWNTANIGFMKKCCMDRMAI